MADVSGSTNGGRSSRAADAAARSASLSDDSDADDSVGAASTSEALGRSPSTSESFGDTDGRGDPGAAAAANAAGTATVDTLAGDAEPARAEASGEPSAVDAAVAAAALAPDGLGLTAHGIERTGHDVQVANPELSVQWESTRSATTGKGGFTAGAEARLDAAGIEVVGTVNGVPAGSIGPGAGLPASQVNTHNGNLARDQIAARFTGPGQSVTLEARYDANLQPVPPEVRNHNVLGDRNVDVQVDIAHPTDPRLNERIEIESKAGRVDAGRVGDAQLGHDAARLSRNGALRSAGRTLEGVGRVARPVGIALDAAEVYGAFRADGDTLGVNTARAGTGLLAGGAGGWGGASVGAAIGTAVFPGAGTVVGAVVGGTIGAIAGSELAKGAFDTVRGWFS